MVLKKEILILFFIFFICSSPTIIALTLENSVTIDIDKPIASTKAFCGCTSNYESCSWRTELQRWFDLDVYYMFNDVQLTPGNKNISIEPTKSTFTIYLRVKNMSQFEECVYNTFEFGGDFDLDSTVMNVTGTFGDTFTENILPRVGKFGEFDSLHSEGVHWRSNVSPPKNDIDTYDANGKRVGNSSIQYRSVKETGYFFLSIVGSPDAYIYEIPIEVDIHPFTHGNITFYLMCVPIGSSSYSGCSVDIIEQNPPSLKINPTTLTTVFDDEKILIKKAIIEKDGMIFVKLYIDTRSEKIDEYADIRGPDGEIPEDIEFEVLKSWFPYVIFKNFPDSGEVFKGPDSFFIGENSHYLGRKIINKTEAERKYDCFHYLGINKGYSYLMMNPSISQTTFLEYIIPYTYEIIRREGNTQYIKDSDLEGYNLTYKVTFSSEGDSSQKTSGSSDGDSKTPGFGLLFVIIAVGVILYFNRKKRK